MTTNNKRWYISSTGRGVSLTIKGVLVGLVPLIAGLARTYGYDLPEGDILELIETSFQAVAVATIVLGLVRKLVIRFRTR